MIIGGISLAGELLNYLLPLPVPASVYGMLLLLICLCTKVIKLDQIQETADFMLVAMPLVFVGPGVALMESFGLMKDSLLGILIISVLSTMVVMVLTGLIAPTLVRRKRDNVDAFHRKSHADLCLLWIYNYPDGLLVRRTGWKKDEKYTL